MIPTFLRRPGRAGALGALMDEYARAAEEFCRVAGGFEAAAWAAERPDPDPDCRSPRTVCEHAVFAAHGYANYLLRARGLEAPAPESAERKAQRKDLLAPADLRPALAEAILRTEEAADAWEGLSDEEVLAREFKVSWGPTYNLESMLEHAIVHLLRHRRQLERWAG